jgi:hypothetical protein
MCGSTSASRIFVFRRAVRSVSGLPSTAAMKSLNDRRSKDPGSSCIGTAASKVRTAPDAASVLYRIVPTSLL